MNTIEYIGKCINNSGAKFEEFCLEEYYVRIKAQHEQYYGLVAPIQSTHKCIGALQSIVDIVPIDSYLCVWFKGNKSFKQSSCDYPGKPYISPKTATECLGFITYYGYSIHEHIVSSDGVFFLFKRKELPQKEAMKRHNVLIPLTRIGKDEKEIVVWKVRTMYKWAEYLQDFIVKEYGYAYSGKLNNDFRVTPIGKLIRRFYIDELPQIVNLLRGDIRLVGCKPVSKLFLSQYPEHLYKARVQDKPGVISPAIASNSKSIEEIHQAEQEYLEQRKHHPFKTDVFVCCKAIFNYMTWKKLGE